MKIVYVSDFTNESFDNKADCLAHEKKYTDMFKSVRFYNGRQRIKCKTVEDCENAYNKCTRIEFPDVETKNLYTEYFGFCAYTKGTYGLIDIADDKHCKCTKYVYDEKLGEFVSKFN